MYMHMYANTHMHSYFPFAMRFNVYFSSLARARISLITASSVVWRHTPDFALYIIIVQLTHTGLDDAVVVRRRLFVHCGFVHVMRVQLNLVVAEQGTGNVQYYIAFYISFRAESC